MLLLFSRNRSSLKIVHIILTLQAVPIRTNIRFYSTVVLIGLGQCLYEIYIMVFIVHNISSELFHLRHSS